MVNRLIPIEHVKLVCKVQQGPATCRYLLLGTEGFECSKGGEFTAHIDARVANNETVAQGDNCDGIYQVPAEE